MFDIGFLELVIIGVVGLLVIGPERLPGAVRTASVWVSRIRRGFNDIKREVQQEIHNDAVMQELRKTGEQLKEQTDGISQDLRNAGRSIAGTVGEDSQPVSSETAKEKPASDQTTVPGMADPIVDDTASGTDTQSNKDAG